MKEIDIRILALIKAIEVIGAGGDPGRIVIVAAKFRDFIRYGVV